MIDERLNKASSKKIVCPICGEIGASVELFTVRSLIKDEFLESIHGQKYFFCANPDCEAIYYSISQEVIRKHQIKTRVGLKEKVAPRPLCYCFGHTIEDIHDEIQLKGVSSVEQEISSKIRDGLCHCEDANPEGRCCLGRVSVAVREAFRMYGSKDEQKDGTDALYDCCKSAITEVE